MAKVPVKAIWIRRATGPNWDLGERLVASFETADAVLRKWAETAPKSGGHDEVDFKITWEDGETYEGRYDLVREDESKADLARHIKEFCSFRGGLWCPPRMKKEAYEEFIEHQERNPRTPKRMDFVRFMERYALGGFHRG